MTASCTWKEVELGKTAEARSSSVTVAEAAVLPPTVSPSPHQLPSVPAVMLTPAPSLSIPAQPPLPHELPALPAVLPTKYPCPSGISDTGYCDSAMDASTVEFMSSEDASDVQIEHEKAVFVKRVEFATMKDAKRGVDSFDGHVYMFHYNYGKRSNKMDDRRVYRCISHENCAKRIRLAPTNYGAEQTVWLQDYGVHTGAIREATKRGIPGFFLAEVDDILLGCGPTKCRKILLERYSDVLSRYACVPDVTQLKNRKATLMKKRADGWEIKNVAELLEWTSVHLCTTASEFFVQGSRGVQDSLFDPIQAAAEFDTFDKELKHGPLVLECFSHEVTLDDGKKTDCCGLILTSRAIFWNVWKAHNSQSNDGILGVTDGTYRLHFGGWTLVDFGTYTTHYERKRYSKTFVPWVYMFVRTEHHVAYATMFETVRTFASRLFDIDLVLAFGSLDCSKYIASAYTAVWPSIRLLNCYPHLARKSGAADKIRLLADKTFYENVVAVNIKYLSKSRSEHQFTAMAELFLKYWRSQGEEEYARWFQATYLTSKWMYWYYQAAVPGVTPSQNALEAHHKTIKATCVATLRSSTAVILNDGIPSILFHQASQPLRQHLHHFSEGPLCSEAVANTKRLLDNKKNYYKLKAPRTRILFGILFNATKFMNTSTNINSADLNRRRAQRYLDSLNGKLPQDISIRNVELHCLSIHQVRILHDVVIAKCFPSARISIEQIQAVRRKYVCDCAMFAQTGWQCSHVLAVMVLQGEVNVNRLLKVLPTRKASGGQRKEKNCLVRDNDHHQFSVDVLVQQYLKHPMSPLHWHVMRDFEVKTKAGVPIRESFRGTVISWGDNDGVYYWTVEFIKLKKTLRLQCQELAECTHEAFIHGVDVTGASSEAAIV